MKHLITKYLALIAGLTAISACVYLYALIPMQSSRAATESITAQAHKILSDHQQTMLTINQYLLRKRELQSKEEFLTARLYNKEDVLSLINHLKEIAQARGLRVKEISPSLSALLALNELPLENGSPRFLDIAIRCTGSFSAAGAFLGELEEEPMFVNLLSFNVISRNDGYVAAEYTVSFSSIVGASSQESKGATH